MGGIVHNIIDVQLQSRGHGRAPGFVLELRFEIFLGGNAGLSHRLFVVFLVVAVQRALATLLVVAVRLLAEMIVGRVSDQWFSAHVAHLHAAGTRHFVAAIGFDEFLFAFRTGPHLCFAEGLFYPKAPLFLVVLLDDFFAPEGDVGRLAAFPARGEVAALDGTQKNVLHLGHLRLVSALGTHGQVLSESRLLDLGLGLHLRILLPGLFGENFLQELVSESGVAPASLAALDFQGRLLGCLVDA
mmetsp:Transcript_49879/g.102733  ORF Transcript_49879/g.102733 Transcript_49879/m.102733 type:complete len:243 (-) Transcript_49879:303-1031(-)